MTSDSDLYDVLKASTSDEAPPARPAPLNLDDRALLAEIVGTLYRTAREVEDELFFAHRAELAAARRALRVTA